MSTNDVKDTMKDNLNKAENAVGLTANEEPATSHDVKEGGILGAVGGAVVGMLAGGPIGAVIGAVAGGAASAAAVNVVDKHDHDYADTAGTAPVGTYSAADNVAHTPAAYAPAAVPVDRAAYGTNLAQNTDEINTDQINADDETVIPIVEEELEVGKRQVQSGGARIRTTVTERPVEEQVTLHEEHVTVDRYTVDQPVLDANTAFQERSFEVTETDEVPVIAKEARVVEEVIVGKTATDRVETIHDTVRRTEVEVEDLVTDGKTQR